MEWSAVDMSQAEYTQEVAYGTGHVYLLVTSPDEVRLTRWRKMSPAFTEAQAARNVVVFPLGRGPGRPGGEPELAALAEAAKVYAERFEAGESLEGCPHWQRGARTDVPGPGTPAMVFLGPGRKRFACERCHANVFTRRGDIFTCNGCGGQYEGIAAAPPEADEAAARIRFLAAGGTDDCPSC